MFTFTKSTILCLSILLTACATQQQQVIIYKTALISPPDNLIMNCLIEPPPPVEAYMAAQLQDREKMLFDTSMQQFKNAGTCNIRLKELRDWKIKQEAIYKQTTK